MMSLVNYGSASSDEDTDESNTTSLLRKLPKPQDTSTNEMPENELEDIVRAENKAYSKNAPTMPKTVKRKRDGPVKIFLPTLEQDSDEEEKPKRKIQTSTKGCALLSSLPPPVYDEDKVSTEKPPQTTATGLFIPYTVSKQKPVNKIVKKKKNTNEDVEDVEEEEEDDDDDDNSVSDFLGLNKKDQVQVSKVDVESVLRETFPKTRITTTTTENVSLEQPTHFIDLDEQNRMDQQQEIVNDDDDELLRYLPQSDRYKEIKSVHIDSMLSESARLQLLKNCSEERETMMKQAAIQVPKGELRKRGQINYLIAKAQADDLKLKNQWSEQKLTKKQTQAKYGF